jgi:hypothetical protein
MSWSFSRGHADETHHAAMRATWVYLRPDKTAVARGEDSYELTPDGRIQRVTGFFGPAPATTPEPAQSAAH